MILETINQKIFKVKIIKKQKVGEKVKKKLKIFLWREIIKWKNEWGNKINNDYEMMQTKKRVNK